MCAKSQRDEIELYHGPGTCRNGDKKSRCITIVIALVKVTTRISMTRSIGKLEPRRRPGTSFPALAEVIMQSEGKKMEEEEETTHGI